MSEKHFDAVIIGSGFGGSVMAYRLAEAGLRVCLLERGKPYPPNSFARSPIQMRNNFWDPSHGQYGLFNVWAFRNSGALVSSGLGGGSLIYANVIIRKDEKWFVREPPNKDGFEYWPVTRADLDPHYDRVEKMLNIQKYPLDHPAYKKTLKTLAMREAAQKLNLEWLPLNLAVSFRTNPVRNPDDDDPNNPPLIGAKILEAYPNYHTVTIGREMQRSTCRLCGECDIGCNYGSKNTLDYNYISEAHRLGAEVRTLCEVRNFEPRASGRGYTVKYVQHDLAREGLKTNTRDLEHLTITCDRLILSAGTFGTPFLLFKSRDAFPNLSKKLGARFSVNGDLLSFIVKAKKKNNGDEVARLLEPSFGPAITSAIRLGDALDGQGVKGRGFYVEDGGNPYFLSWAAELTGFVNILRRLALFGKRFVKYRLGFSRHAPLDDEIAQLIGDCDSSKSSMPILTMGRDFANGTMTFDGAFVDCDWTVKKSKDYYKRVVSVVSGIAGALNATYMDNPSYKYLHQVVTAHPLGGCSMAPTEDEGVVNPCGEVFNYPGLYIADGSVMPGPVGPNPSMTIAAMSDRFADHIIAQHKGENHGCKWQ
jgi:cholesterol oxidase